VKLHYVFLVCGDAVLSLLEDRWYCVVDRFGHARTRRSGHGGGQEREHKYRTKHGLSEQQAENRKTREQLPVHIEGWNYMERPTEKHRREQCKVHSRDLGYFGYSGMPIDLTFLYIHN